MELRDFQRQIGPSSQQARLRVRLIQLGQIADGQGQQAAFVAAVQFCGLGRGNGLELSDCLALLCIELIGSICAAGLLGGSKDGAVTGTATQVARECFVRLTPIIVASVVLLQGEQRHHKARGAETALRTVAVDHCPLHAVQLALVLEVFNADQLLAVQGRNKGQARVDTAIAQALGAFIIGMQFTHHYRAGTAVAAGATFLGAGFVQVFAQVSKHGHIRVQHMLGAQRLVE